jgi:hypothetical protein
MSWFKTYQEGETYRQTGEHTDIFYKINDLKVTYLRVTILTKKFDSNKSRCF